MYKDLREKKICSEIIYCCHKTFCHFNTRAAEHMGVSNLTGKRIKNFEQTAISDHQLLCNCAINYDSLGILVQDSKKFKVVYINGETRPKTK